MLVKRKGQWVDISDEEEDENDNGGEEEVREDYTPTPEQHRLAQERVEASEREIDRDIDEVAAAEELYGRPYEKWTGAEKKEYFSRRQSGFATGSYLRDAEGSEQISEQEKREWEEANKRIDKMLAETDEEQRKEDAGIPVPRTKAERIAEKIELQKQRAELAELRRQEIAAGGGGAAGLIKRTVSGARREVSSEIRRGRAPSRGQRARSGRLLSTGKKNYGLYAVPGAKRLVTPTGVKVARGAKVRPQGDGLSVLRNATMPSGTGRSDLFKPASIGRSDLLKPAGISGVKPMGLGKVPDNLKPAKFDAKYMKPMGLNAAKMSTAKLGLSAKGNMLKPVKLDFKKGQSKLMGGAVKKKVSNRQYNKNMKRLLKMQRL